MSTKTAADSSFAETRKDAAAEKYLNGGRFGEQTRSSEK